MSMLPRFLPLTLAATSILCGQTPPARRGTSPGVPTAHLDYTPGKAPRFWSVATAETIMARYPDYRDAYWKPWSYVHGYMFAGFEMLYRSTGDKRYLDYMRTYIDRFVDHQGAFSGDKLNSLDNLMTGTTIAALYGYTHDVRYKTAAAQFRAVFDTYPRSADGQFWHGERLPQMWIDGVFMGQMFAVRYGKEIGDSDYCWNEAVKQVTVFAKHAEDGHSGLYRHAWVEDATRAVWADPKTGFSPEVWSEGLGWYSLVIPELLAAMPAKHPGRDAVLDIYTRLAAGLRRTQDPKTGGWFMMAAKGSEPGNWIDPSGTAMFVYAIQRGIDLGLLPKAGCEPVARKGYAALLTFAHVNERGLVDIEGGGDGIGVKKDFASYVKFPRTVNAKETVGGFLWASAIMERAAIEKAR